MDCQLIWVYTVVEGALNLITVSRRVIDKKNLEFWMLFGGRCDEIIVIIVGSLSPALVGKSAFRLFRKVAAIYQPRCDVNIFIYESCSKYSDK